MDRTQLDAFFRGEKGFGSVGMQNLAAPLSALPRREQPLRAYHVLSTLPRRTGRPEQPFSLAETDLLTARLSALLWRRYNGPICLITDRAGADYARQIGLEEHYDQVLTLLPENNWGIDPDKFWASGKILALRQLSAPCVILDMDLMVWEPLPLEDVPLAAAHTEPLRQRTYPPLSEFSMSPRYRFPDWDQTLEPLNTSILYMGSEALRSRYTRCAIDFMQYERYTPDNGVRCMVFAEQRILAMCAGELGIRAQTFLDYPRLDAPQTLITHTWTGKRLLHTDKEAAQRFSQLCREKLLLLQHTVKSSK